MGNNVTLAIRLFAILNSESRNSADYVIAKYLIENINDSNITTSSLADKCNVSKSSVSRFCRKAGLNDFFELRAQMFSFSPQKSYKFDNIISESMIDTRKNYISQYIENLLFLQNTMDDLKLNALINDIKNFQNIVVMGNMQSGNTALSLQNNLFITGKVIQALTNPSEQLSYFQTCSKDDLVIIFSVSGNFLDNLFVNHLDFDFVNKPKIYLITCNPNIKTKKFIDVLYNCKNGFGLSAGNSSLDFIEKMITISYYHLTQNKNSLDF